MMTLSRRFAAIWFAGRNNRSEMLHYQIHELEELLAEIEEASPTENGIDVANRLNSDVLSKLEALETRIDDPEAFEQSYREIAQNCSSCHADTGHDYIDVTVPTRNPYANIDLGRSGDGN
jgi:hypothetical protein